MASKFKREFKNVVLNYSDAEAKVREATSNDPWGPSSAVMTELADYTFHVQAYSLVMGMLWRRLNDHGKNWRHVYKALIVLEYLIKGGSERVSQQCKDNMFSIQTLKDFQYLDKDGKDQGANVREKAKQLVALLKDDRKLKEERAKAHTARERQQALGSDSPVLRASPTPGRKKVTFGSPDTSATSPTSENGNRVQPVEQARPSNQSEEDMQLKLALQLSKQQADEENTLRRQEEESLTAALALSVTDAPEEEEKDEDSPPSSSVLLLDLDTSIKDPWGPPPNSEPLPSYDSVVQPAAPIVDPWSVGGAPLVAMGTDFNPWGGGDQSVTAASTTSLPPPVPTVDPWSMPPTAASSSYVNPPPPQHNPFDLSDLGITLPPTSSGGPQPLPKIEAQFLGTNSANLANLVDLDLLTVAPPKPQPVPDGPSPTNPFGLSSSPSASTSLTGLKPVGNPFDTKAPSPSLNQLAGPTNSIGFGALDPLQAPLVPMGTTSPSVAMGNTMYPSLTTAGTAPGNNQTFNPFS